MAVPDDGRNAGPSPRPITRRQVIEHLGMAVGYGYAASLGLVRVARDAEAAIRVRGERGVPTATRPQRPIIRTLFDDVAPEALPNGAVLFHEHLSMRFPLGATSHFTDDVDLMVEEAQAARTEGIALIVDGGHPDMQRDLDALRRISTEAGMPVVASGGFYMERYYPPEVAAKSAEQLADDLVAEAERDRLGAFGEIGQQGGEMTGNERMVFEAVGMAHARTGIPVFTHTPYSVRATTVPRDAALRQLDILESVGARPGSVCIGHVCCLDDPSVEVASEIARRGAYVGFDRVGLNATMPDANRVAMAIALIEAGHGDRLLLSSDFYSAQALKRNGGPGLARTATEFAPMLLGAGLAEETLRGILEDNPRRFLSFTPNG